MTSCLLLRPRVERPSRCSTRRSAPTCAGPSSASADREALVVRHQELPRAPTPSCGTQVDHAARALLARGVQKGDRVGIWAPNRYEWVVDRSSPPRASARSSSRSTPPTRRPSWRHALDKAGVSLLVMARGFRGADYVAMLDGPRRCRALRTRSCSRTTGRRSWPRARASPAPSSPRARRRCTPTTRSTSSSRRARRARPRARRSRTTTSSTTRTSSAARWATREHDRVCVPVPFYHCFGMVLGNLALRRPRRVHRRAGRVVRRRGGAGDGRGRALHLALRRADDVHRRARAPAFERFDLSSLRTGMMGGAPCPVEVMKQVRSRMHMERGRRSSAA